ncbi:hypothetical protein ACFL4D_01990 [Candidatus Margulisiibacteriota bacterium]
MVRNILVVTISKRKNEAIAVQKILTEWGCIIKTRLGIHDGVLDDCSNDGVLILELVGEADKQKQMISLLANLPGVKTHLVELGV